MRRERAIRVGWPRTPAAAEGPRRMPRAARLRPSRGRAAWRGVRDRPAARQFGRASSSHPQHPLLLSKCGGTPELISRISKTVESHLAHITLSVRKLEAAGLV